MRSFLLPFLSTWLFDLFCCCLYILFLLFFLLFLKLHLYYILGPRDHPDIVDSFMQLQAQVCFWFLISFTLVFSLFPSLSPSHTLVLLSLSFTPSLFLSALCFRVCGDPFFAWADKWALLDVFPSKVSVRRSLVSPSEMQLVISEEENATLAVIQFMYGQLGELWVGVLLKHRYSHNFNTNCS